MRPLLSCSSCEQVCGCLQGTDVRFASRFWVVLLGTALPPCEGYSLLNLVCF